MIDNNDDFDVTKANMMLLRSQLTERGFEMGDLEQENRMLRARNERLENRRLTDEEVGQVLQDSLSTNEEGSYLDIAKLVNLVTDRLKAS